MSASNASPTWKHCTLVLVLVAATATLVAGVEIKYGAEAGVQEFLPAQLGNDWVGDEVLFCQSPTCGRSWLTRDVTTGDTEPPSCPEDWQGNRCDGQLFTMSLGERMILPPDTVMLKKKYENLTDPDRAVFCSVVFSGEHRNSIHRPETCMVGQGHVIENNVIIEVPLEGREPLEVMILHLSRKISENRFHHSYYAYWFVGKERETPLHHERMIWMSLDRVFKNITHRWAYIAVSGNRNEDLRNTDHYEEIREVVGQLYPQISLQKPDA